MFPKAQRLQTTRDIFAALRKGERKVVGCVNCSFLATPGFPGRATVIVDSKTAPLATVRNLLKRRTRAALRQRGLPAGKLVVRLQRGAPALSYDDLRKQLYQCLDRLATTRSSVSR